MELQAAESEKILKKVDEGYKEVVDLAVNQAQEACYKDTMDQINCGPDRKRKGRARVQSALLGTPTPPSTTGPTHMDWAEDVAELERLVDEERVSHHSARQLANPPTKPNMVKSTAPHTRANAHNTSVPQQKPNAKATTSKSATPKPAGGISYAAVVKSAPRTGTDTAWTTVIRGGKSRGSRPQHQAQPTRQQTPVQGLNLDQRKFVFVRDSTPVIPFYETKLISAVSMALYQEMVPTHIRIFQL